MSNSHIVNSGTLIRRKSDEMAYEPFIGVLLDDGTIKRKRLDTTTDRFHDNVKERDETPFNMKDFMNGLKSLGEHGLDFQDVVRKHLKTSELSVQTQEMILEALDKHE